MRLLLTALFAVMCVAVVVPASSESLDSTMTGPLGTLTLRSEATFSEGWWTYEYMATITGATANITGLTIANVYRLPFEDAQNSANFGNPAFTGSDSVIWTKGNVPASEGVISFSFRSTYAPTVGNATFWGGNIPSTGQALTMVPEPSSIAALGIFSLGGLVGITRKYRFKR